MARFLGLLFAWLRGFQIIHGIRFAQPASAVERFDNCGWTLPYPVAFDCGQGIDLDECERRITASKQRTTMRHRRRAPSYFQYRPLPLRVAIPCDAVPIDSEYDTTPTVEIMPWDFGAALVTYTVPLDRFLGLSNALFGHPAIWDQARWRL